MHRHDDDIIAALAEGSIEPDRAAEVEATVLADPEAASALRAQREAIEAARAAGPVLMSAAERSALRGRVADRLGLEAAHPAAATPGRARRRLAAIAVSATALIAVLAITPLVGMLSTGGVGFEFDSATLRSAEQATAGQDDAWDDSESILSSATDDLPGVIGFGEDPESPPGTMVVDTTEDATGATTTKPADAPPLDTAEDGLIDELEILMSLAPGAFSEAVPVDEESACGPEAHSHFDDGSGEPAQVRVAEYVSNAGRMVLVFFMPDDDSGEIHTVTAFDPETCVVVATAPGR
jgi:hypothetical protein